MWLHYNILRTFRSWGMRLFIQTENKRHMYFFATSDVNVFYTVESIPFLILFIWKVKFYFKTGKVLMFFRKVFCISFIVSMPFKFVLFSLYTIFVFIFYFISFFCFNEQVGLISSVLFWFVTLIKKIIFRYRWHHYPVTAVGTCDFLYLTVPLPR